MQFTAAMSDGCSGGWETKLIGVADVDVAVTFRETCNIAWPKRTLGHPWGHISFYILHIFNPLIKPGVPYQQPGVPYVPYVTL